MTRSVIPAGQRPPFGKGGDPGNITTDTGFPLVPTGPLWGKGGNDKNKKHPDQNRGVLIWKLFLQIFKKLVNCFTGVSTLLKEQRFRTHKSD